MVLPINGRIAIVDDDYKQALPIIQALARKQIPCTYYDSSLEGLPDEGNSDNDIRLLFLDINLIDNTNKDRASIKSKLIGVLRRIISPTNYPYLLTYWSRHETEDKELIEEIFTEDLIDRAPIGYISASKSDYISMSGLPVEGAPTIDNLFDRVHHELNTIPVYTYLLQWENLVHKAADQTFQEIFSNNKSGDDWKNQAEAIVNSLGKSLAGDEIYASQEPNKKVASSLSAFSNVFQDTLEYSINSEIYENAVTLTPPAPTEDLSPQINFKLLFSNEVSPLNYSGSVLEYLNSDLDSEYEEFLTKSVLKKSAKRTNIQTSWRKVWICVNPLCDVVQGKLQFNRLIRGILVNGEFSDCFYSNEAVYTSPCFSYVGNIYCLVLDFRHFFALKEVPENEHIRPLFRAKQQLLAEIQSKLARHVNRQGILFLDKK